MTAQEKTQPAPRLIAVDSIDPSPDNRHCDDADKGILELSANIRDNGLINPITVRPLAGGRFEIVCGERRWRAHRAGGVAEILCCVQDMDDARAQILRLSENLMRADLTYMEQGEGVAALLRATGNDYSEAANRLDRTESWIRRRAKLPNLAREWREAVADPAGPYRRVHDSVDKLEEIARLPHDTQRELLRSGVLAGVVTTPELRRKIMRHLRQIGSEPWSRDWEKSKTSSSRRCAKCQKRSDREATLFDDIHKELPGGKKAMCLDASCWQNKLLAWCKHLLDENPEAAPVWDGAFTQAEHRDVRDSLGRDILPGYAWSEHARTDPLREGDVQGTGVFVGGVRTGQTADIVIFDPDYAGKADAAQAERMAQRRREEAEREERGDRLRAAVGDAIPGSVADLAGRFHLDAPGLMAAVLNLAAAFGVNSAPDAVEFGNGMLLNAGDLAVSPPPCAASIWSHIRSEIITLLVDADPEFMDDTDQRLRSALRTVFRLESLLPETEA